MGERAQVQPRAATSELLVSRTRTPASAARDASTAERSEWQPAATRASDSVSLLRMLGARQLQARLSVGAPDDAFEREADATADVVTRMATTDLGLDDGFETSRAGAARARRRPIADDITPVARRTTARRAADPKGEEAEKKKEEEKRATDATAQKRAVDGAASRLDEGVPAGVESAIGTMSAGGDPLAGQVRDYFEPRFGRDLGHVRTHTSHTAAAASRALEAQAFTVGEHIFFGAGQYQPESASGRHLLAHELTHTIQQRPELGRRSLFRRIVQRGLIDDARAKVLGKIRGYALELPPYELLTVILGRDPITDQPVERSAVNYVRATLKLVPEGDAIFKDLQESKTIEKTSAFLGAEFAKLDLSWPAIKALFRQAYDAISLTDLLDPDVVWEKIKQVFAPTLARVKDFAVAVGGKIIDEIKQRVLAKLSAWARTMPGFGLLTFILGRDPFTDEVVERTAKGFVRAVLELVPDGDQIYENLEKAKTIERTVEWLEAEIKKLDLSFEKIKALFLKLWITLSTRDLLNPLGLIEKVTEIFAAPAKRVLSFALAVGKKVLEFIFEGAMMLAGPLGKQIIGFVRKVGDTFTRIVENPIGFLENLIDALKRGFTQFVGNILEHLRAGLIAWLVGALEGAGLVLPEKWDLQGILSVALQILGITWAKMRAKLVKIVGEEKVAFLERAFDFIVLLVTKGPAAAWERIVEAIGNFWELVIGGIRDWAITKIITAAVTKLLSALNPAGAIIQAIIAVYNTIAFFVERFKQIVALVEAIVDSIANIAAGKLEPAANYVEKTMARTIPVILGFLARLIGLGDVSGAIRRVIEAIQARVDQAIDFVLAWIVDKAKALFGKSAEPTPPATEDKHEAILADIAEKLQVDPPELSGVDDAEWTAKKKEQVEALVQDHEAAVEEGSNLAVTLTPGDDPRQLAYELVIAPNTTVLTGKTGIPPTPPGLVPGERYTFFVDINGHPSPDIGKFVRVGTFMSQLVIYYDASETIDIPYYKPQRDTGKYGHGKALSLAPAYQPDGSVNFRLASLGGGEPPIFTYTANGAYAMSVKGEPIALTAYSAPRETPPGLERIRPDLRSAGTWLPGHLVNGEFGGPGLNVNMVPITVKTNAKMRGNYENSLRTSLELGLYFRFEADVTYHKANPRAAVGKTTDFVEEINVKYQVIARSGSGWVNVGNVGTAGPYGDAVPTVAELDPTRVAF